jgi:lipid A 3-O-deacylase
MKSTLQHLKKAVFTIILITLPLSNLIGQERNYIALSTAVFDILQQSDPSFEVRTEFRMGKIDLLVHPFSGVMVNTEGAMHVYLGLYYDIQLTDFLSLTPSFAPGLYAKNRSKDLKFALEFQSQIEISFKLTNGSRIGISFNHISNAALGVENPGVESLALTYIIPL